VDGSTRAEMAETDLGDGGCRDNIMSDGYARLSRIVVGRQAVEVARSENVEESFNSSSIFRALDSLRYWFILYGRRQHPKVTFEAPNTRIGRDAEM
jgi:hypothetical protein